MASRDGGRVSCRFCGLLLKSTLTASRHEKRCDLNPQRGESGFGGGQQQQQQQQRFHCDVCDAGFTRRRNMMNHRRKHEQRTPAQRLLCGMCTASFRSRDALLRHRREQHQQQQQRFQYMGGAHRRANELYRMNIPDEIVTIDECLDVVREQAVPLLRQLLARRKRIKVSLVLTVKLTKMDADGEEDNRQPTESTQFHLRSMHLTLMLHGEQTVEQQMSKLCMHIANQFDDFAQNGSGWVLAECETAELEIGECLPLSGGSAGGCYMLHLVRKGRRRNGVARHEIEELGERVVLGSEGDDHRCFYRALAACLLFTASGKVPTLEEIRVYLEENVHEVVSGAVEVKHIARIEEANAHLDVAVNVICQSEDGDFFPVRASRRVDAKHVVNMLLFHTAAAGEEEEESEQGRTPPHCHFAWVQNLPQFLGSKGRTPKHFCMNCFNSFTRESTLRMHVAWCHEKNAQRLILPDQGDTIEFLPKNKSVLAPFCFVYDFECYMARPSRACRCSTEEELTRCTHKSKVVAEHVPFAYSYLLFDREGKVLEDRCYIGEDCAEHFITLLLDMEKQYLGALRYGGHPLQMTEEDERAFQAAVDCYLCNKPMAPGDKCRDHCHLGGNFLGAAHNRCNFLRREAFSMVGFAHNQAHYDGNIIVRAVADRLKRDKNSKILLNAIPLNGEHFKCLRLNSTTLLDSLSFLGDSLEKLVETLVASKHDFPLLKQWLPEDRTRQLLLRKGVYPYEMIDGLEVLNNTKSLPPRDRFYSNLTGSGIAAEEHAYAGKVWETFGCRSLRDYTELYCRTDTYLLAEAITELRGRVYNEFELDICHYLSLPQLSKDMFLKSSGAQIELVSDADMIEFFRANIRGGLSYVNQRYTSSKEESRRKGRKVHTLYSDANNLYGAAMRLPLPVGDYMWHTAKEMEALDPNRDFSFKNDRGYVCEVTLEYPPELHELHSSFPLAPHQMTITEKHLSPYARRVKRLLTGESKHKSSKLTSTFLPRERYVCHGANLRLYLDLGLRVVEWHRGVSFKQAPFIRDYIEMCARKRAAAPTKSMANFFKLAANSLYGKWIEDALKRMDAKFCMDREAALRCNTDPRLKATKILSEELTIAFLSKKAVQMRQSWPVGFSILELSKYIMQSLYYYEIMPRFGNKVSVLVSDTDSFILQVPAETPDSAMTILRDIMDFSNYDPDHPLYDDSRKNRPGLLKNELPGWIITETVGIRAKTYALKMRRKKTKKQQRRSKSERKVESRCKGVKKSVRKSIHFNAFKRAVLGQRPLLHEIEQYTLQSKTFQNRTMRSKKIAFSSFDDKRYLLCAVHSVPYGSRLIRESERLGQCYFCANPEKFS